MSFLRAWIPHQLGPLGHNSPLNRTGSPIRTSGLELTLILLESWGYRGPSLEGGVVTPALTSLLGPQLLSRLDKQSDIDWLLLLSLKLTWPSDVLMSWSLTNCLSPGVTPGAAA